MKTVLPWLLLAALVVHLVAHVVIAVAFARERSFKRAALAFFLPPFAPLYGWRAGMRAPVYAWTGALLVYALGIAAA
jgi:hypothetical protein